MKYSANYDKYPFVQVSYNSDDCISGWFAITDSISERLKVLEKPLKVVVIECTVFSSNHRKLQGR